MHVSTPSTRRKNRWQINRAAGKAWSRRMLAGKARKRLESPAPDYPPIIDSSRWFLRITVETPETREQWALYPGKQRAHHVEINGERRIDGNRGRHSISQVFSELRKNAAAIERRLRYSGCRK